MFAKLLKHEWRNCRQILGVLCAITLGSGLTVGLTTVYLTWTEGQKSYFLAALLMMLAILTIGICAASGFLYLIWRFYQSRFTDEGYLTFTLPANNHQQLLAAMVNIFRGSFLVFLSALGAIALAALVCFLAFSPWDMNWSQFFQAVWKYLPEFIDSVYWPDYFLALAFLLTWLVRQVVVLMLCVTLGAVLARKHHFLTAAAVYYSISIVHTWGLFVYGFADDVGLWDYELLFNLLAIAAGYFLMHWLTGKKLNLA